MVKLGIGLLVLLTICVIAAVIRKARGGSFFPAPDMVDGKYEPQSLRDMVERRRSERSRASD
jgi:hypothetical protein